MLRLFVNLNLVKRINSLYIRWLSGDTLTRSEPPAGGLSLYDLGGPFMLLAIVVTFLLAATVARHCVGRRQRSLAHFSGAKLVSRRHRRHQ